MKKSYHLTEAEVIEIVKDHFVAKGENVSKVVFKLHAQKDDWGHGASASFSEALIYLEDGKDEQPAKSNDGNRG
jgi:hypothetical protein